MGEVTVYSTTDDQQSVNAAAYKHTPGDNVGEPIEEPEEKPAPTGHPQVESEAVEQEPAPEPKEQKQPVPRAVDKRIDKLTREKNELAARLAALESKAMAAAGAPPEEKHEPEVPKEVAAKFDTFDTWSAKQIETGKPANIDDFLEARDAWKDARRQEQEEKSAVQAYESEVAQAYDARIDAFKADHPEWEEIVGAAEFVIPPGFDKAIRKLDNGPAVVWHLATHAAEAKKLAEMDPIEAIAYAGKLSAKLEKGDEKEQDTIYHGGKAPDRIPIVSKAPAPMQPLGGHGVRASVDLNDPNLTYEQYRRIRDEQEKARYKR